MPTLDRMADGTPIIDQFTPHAVTFDPARSRGAVPRDFSVQPATAFAPPSAIDLIPESEWEARWQEQEDQQSSLEHLYLNAGWENLDQNGQGYCWAYSVGHTIMLCRTRDGQPYVRLNPHGVASQIKGGRDEGGWCGLSAEFARAVGYPPEGTGPGQWPKWQYRNPGQYTTPALQAEEQKYKITSDFVDLARPVYNQNLTFAQVASNLFRNNPCAVDFNWWSHSVCGIRIVKIEAGSFGLLILNSWLNWGRRGLAVLRGSSMYPDGAVCTAGVSAAGPSAPTPAPAP